ncbi:MAG TPA: diguanylate cyclase, partial [Rhodanobacter sp.]|nr:diguanylate cyclase [Rhodanobacter sp.]
RASASRLSQLGVMRRYTEAFELANRLAARLPQVADAKARYALLLNLAQAMGLAGQTDLAVRYAQMAMTADPSPSNRCYAAGILVEVLFDGRRLKPDSLELQQAFDACPMATESLYNTGLTLNLASLYARGGQPHKALALLDRIQPRVDAAGYASDKLTALQVRAWALVALGKDDAARKTALAAVAAGPAIDFDQKDTYEVLYRVEKQRGNAAAALGYYEKYAALDTAYLDDVNARALAYQVVQQRVLAQQLETARLAQQNTTLRMRRALDAKKAEAARRYALLLLVILALAVVAMLRLKRSQLRFKQLSRLDGLTGLLNRQHFVAEAEGALHELERRRAPACMVFIDLDHFKRVNDTHGHAAGDEVLRRTVDASRQHLRPIDLFGRLGGEEFGILLMGCTREQGVTIADRIRHAVEATSVALDGATIAVSTSAGLAFTDTCGYTLQRLFHAADMGLYKAKRGGRNRVFVEVAETG